MSGSSVIDDIDSDLADAWCGDATSVVEFLRPLRAQLDAPGVLEVCVNRPGEMMVETAKGWQSVVAAELTLERCLSLATAVATYSDQQINQEHPLLSATLPTGERGSVRRPAGGDARNRVDHDSQARAADPAPRRLRARRPVRAHGDRRPKRGL